MVVHSEVPILRLHCRIGIAYASFVFTIIFQNKRKVRLHRYSVASVDARSLYYNDR